MTVALNRAYQGFPAGTVVDLDAVTESALVQQGIASQSSAAITAGAQAPTNVPSPWLPVASGYAAVAAGVSTVVITIPGVTAQHKAWAVINQAAADATLTSIVRVQTATGAGGVGTVTIVGNANATAATRVAYWVTT